MRNLFSGVQLEPRYVFPENGNSKSPKRVIKELRRELYENSINFRSHGASRFEGSFFTPSVVFRVMEFSTAFSHTAVKIKAIDRHELHTRKRETV